MTGPYYYKGVDLGALASADKDSDRLDIVLDSLVPLTHEDIRREADKGTDHPVSCDCEDGYLVSGPYGYQDLDLNPIIECPSCGKR